ncbi:hypothetical protein PspLS_03260 [Pyricularia sp. CBS 133598]|nr:hypothetical protein PspLS_03260 [Pyricularia sp. CBS 133598]
MNASAHIASRRTTPPAMPPAMAATGTALVSTSASLMPPPALLPPNTNISYDDDGPDPDPLVATAQNDDLGSGIFTPPDASCEWKTSAATSYMYTRSMGMFCETPERPRWVPPRKMTRPRPSVPSPSRHTAVPSTCVPGTTCASPPPAGPNPDAALERFAQATVLKS